jgi:hypothetical protein
MVIITRNAAPPPVLDQAHRHLSPSTFALPTSAALTCQERYRQPAGPCAHIRQSPVPYASAAAAAAAAAAVHLLAFPQGSLPRPGALAPHPQVPRPHRRDFLPCPALAEPPARRPALLAGARLEAGGGRVGAGAVELALGRVRVLLRRLVLQRLPLRCRRLPPGLSVPVCPPRPSAHQHHTPQTHRDGTDKPARPCCPDRYGTARDWRANGVQRRAGQPVTRIAAAVHPGGGVRRSVGSSRGRRRASIARVQKKAHARARERPQLRSRERVGAGAGEGAYRAAAGNWSGPAAPSRRARPGRRPPPPPSRT